MVSNFASFISVPIPENGLVDKNDFHDGAKADIPTDASSSMLDSVRTCLSQSLETMSEADLFALGLHDPAR